MLCRGTLRATCSVADATLRKHGCLNSVSVTDLQRREGERNQHGSVGIRARVLVDSALDVPKHNQAACIFNPSGFYV